MFNTTRFTLAIVSLVLLALATNAILAMGAPVGQPLSSTNSNGNLLDLGAGTAGVGISQTAAGDVALDLTRGGAVGINPNARYTYGNPSAPVKDHAFTLTSGVENSTSMTIEYRGVEAVGDGIDHVSFKVFDAAGEHVMTASEERTGMFAPAGPGTYYVVMVVDTSGLDATSDLSGSIKVSA